MRLKPYARLLKLALDEFCVPLVLFANFAFFFSLFTLSLAFTLTHLFNIVFASFKLV
jgi:hypothetical protein